MKPVLAAGITIVNLALVSYTTAIVLQSIGKRITRNVITFLTIGIILDVTSTVCMIIGSGHVLTIHGVIGYSSLAGMLADTIVSWRNVKRNGIGSSVSVRFNRWSITAWAYWVVAYITGAVIIMVR